MKVYEHADTHEDADPGEEDSRIHALLTVTTELVITTTISGKGKGCNRTIPR
jgi:hypothetical protein